MNTAWILQSVIDRTNPCKKTLRVSIADNPVPKYDYESICLTNDWWTTKVKWWSVIDNTTNPPVINLFLADWSDATWYDLVACWDKTIDREKIEICKQNWDWKWKQISFMNVEDATDIVWPIFINPNWIISPDPLDLINCEDAKRIFMSSEVIVFDKINVKALTIPTWANHAEMEPIDWDIQFRYSTWVLTKADIITWWMRVQDWWRLETQSLDEATKFQFVWIKTNILGTPRLVINYFYAPKLD